MVLKDHLICYVTSHGVENDYGMSIALLHTIPMCNYSARININTITSWCCAFTCDVIRSHVGSRYVPNTKLTVVLVWCVGECIAWSINKILISKNLTCGYQNSNTSQILILDVKGIESRYIWVIIYIITISNHVEGVSISG